MKSLWRDLPIAIPIVLLALPVRVLSADILQSNGFSMCSTKSDISVQKLNIKFNKDTKEVAFDVAGTSSKVQQVTATLTVTAYGQNVYTKEFDPCDNATRVEQLCPVPSGSYSATGTQTIPNQYASLIPAIAFTVPDLDGNAKLEFKAKDTGSQVACIQSEVTNGKTVSVPAVPFLAAGLAGGALVVSGVSALAAGGSPGAAGPSPSFGDMIGWFQSMALNGMLSVNYPPVYRSFAKNFAFSGLLIPWDGMQRSIDTFRRKTGGNLTNDNVDYLKNTAFVYDQGSNSTLSKRSWAAMRLVARAENATETPKTTQYVRGIEGFVEPLLIPKSNTFMSVLLVVAIIIAAIIVGILLFKLILELVSLMGKLSKPLESFRKRYWWVMAKTITSLILLLYGVWTLYCVYQFTIGDSWAARVLAGVTLALFTAVLGWFTWRIWSLARMYKKADGDASALYENKETWRKYSLFYENYKKNYWWIFIPAIIYTFARGVIIAAGNGHGLVQTGGQLIIEALMLLLLVFVRPYTRKSGNWINITIQVVRVLSILCILVFVDQLAISSAPKAITGIVLVAMQTALTGLLAILIIINGLLSMCRKNPHKAARKAAQQDRDTLTPLDSRNSLLLSPNAWKAPEYRAYQPAYHTRKVSDVPSMRAPLLPQVTLKSQTRGSPWAPQPYY